jgi:hypothetical protein
MMSRPPLVPTPVPDPDEAQARRQRAFDAACLALQVGLYEIDGTQLAPDVVQTLVRRVLHAYFNRLHVKE